MHTDDDLRALLRSAAPAPIRTAPDARALARRATGLRRRRRLSGATAVVALVALVVVGVPSLGALQRDADVALLGGEPTPSTAATAQGPVDVPFRLLEVEHPSEEQPGSVRQLNSAEMFNLDDRLRAGTPLGEQPLRPDEVVLEVVTVASTCVPTLEGLTRDGRSLVLRLGEAQQFADGAYLDRRGCRDVRLAAALRIAVDVHPLPSPVEVTVPDVDPAEVPQPVTVALAGPGWGVDPRGWVVPLQSLGPRTALDLRPGDARQIVGEELLALDAALDGEFAGQADPLQPQDVVLAIAPLRCTPRVAHLRLDGDRLLVHTQDGGCTEGHEGDVGVDTVVVERAALPERFEVVLADDGVPRASVSPPVIELLPDAPPEPAPPRDYPIRVLGVLSGSPSEGLVEGAALERAIDEGIEAPRP